MVWLLLLFERLLYLCRLICNFLFLSPILAFFLTCLQTWFAFLRHNKWLTAIITDVYLWMPRIQFVISPIKRLNQRCEERKKSKPNWTKFQTKKTVDYSREMLTSWATVTARLCKLLPVTVRHFNEPLL